MSSSTFAETSGRPPSGQAESAIIFRSHPGCVGRYLAQPSELCSLRPRCLDPAGRFHQESWGQAWFPDLFCL